MTRTDAPSPTSSGVNIGDRPSTKPRDATPLVVVYTNHRGETALRKIVPLGCVRYDSTDWHPEPQWLLPAFDVEKQAKREFAMKGFAAPDRDALQQRLAARTEGK